MKKITILLTLVAATVATADVVQLDISSGFTTDNWIGVKEYQALWNEGATDLRQAQDNNSFYTNPTNAWMAIQMYGMMLCEINNATAQSLGCYDDGLGNYYGYVYGTNYGYKNSTQATPIDGVLTSGIDGRIYHIASHVGNATYAGDWTEVSNPSFTGSGDNVTVSMEAKVNAMSIVTAFDKSNRQIISAEATLSVGQQGYYSDINFVLGSWDQSDYGLNGRIIAVYDDGEETLYTFNTDAGNPIAQAPLPGADANEDAAFTLIHSSSEGYDNTTGNYGAPLDANRASNLYEFTTPLELDETRLLVGVKLIDINPAENWDARGVSIFGASATPVPEPATMIIMAAGIPFMLKHRRKQG